MSSPFNVELSSIATALWQNYQEDDNPKEALATQEEIPFLQKIVTDFYKLKVDNDPDIDKNWGTGLLTEDTVFFHLWDKWNKEPMKSVSLTKEQHLTVFVRGAQVKQEITFVAPIEIKESLILVQALAVCHGFTVAKSFKSEEIKDLLCSWKFVDQGDKVSSGQYHSPNCVIALLLDTNCPSFQCKHCECMVSQLHTVKQNKILSPKCCKDDVLKQTISKLKLSTKLLYQHFHSNNENTDWLKYNKSHNMR